jgi:hypothetical protein
MSERSDDWGAAKWPEFHLLSVIYIGTWNLELGTRYSELPLLPRIASSSDRMSG